MLQSPGGCYVKPDALVRENRCGVARGWVVASNTINLRRSRLQNLRTSLLA